MIPDSHSMIYIGSGDFTVKQNTMQLEISALYKFTKQIYCYVKKNSKALSLSLSLTLCPLAIKCFVTKLYVWLKILDEIWYFGGISFTNAILLNKIMCLSFCVEWHSEPVIFLPRLSSFFWLAQPRLLSMYFIFRVIVSVQFTKNNFKFLLW